MASDCVVVRWHGQACVTILSPSGTCLLVDPFDESIGHRLPDVEPDVVVVTHNHYDHANVEGVRGRPKVLRGVTPDGRWAAIDETAGDMHLRTVGTWHDEVRGAKRGLNSLVVVETQGMHVVHCGDLGHLLSDEQVRAVGPVDVLLVPVGGVYTVGAREAAAVVRQLGPRRAVIPIHFRTPPLTIRLEPVDSFLAGQPGVVRLESNELSVPLAPPETDPHSPRTVVLAWEAVSDRK
jgi:L-ascorbate metabolism protein UlaG (beta-lactamase superfamily)